MSSQHNPRRTPRPTVSDAIAAMRYYDEKIRQFQDERAHWQDYLNSCRCALPYMGTADQSDPVGEFLCERTMPASGKKNRVKAIDVYAAFCHWCNEHDMDELTLTAFGRSMTKRGVFRCLISGVTYYRGFALISTTGSAHNALF